MQALGLSVSIPYCNSRFSINAYSPPLFMFSSSSTIPINLSCGFSKSLTYRNRVPSWKLSYVVCAQKKNDDDDGFFMRKSVELARKGLGYTSPNPLVGCVIVKDGKVVGQGFHPKAGQPHAEVFALRDAGDLAENATAYVTLEPCNHFGRTPPCTEALIKARVKKVVVGMVDPNPIVASKGVDRLRSAGIEVVVGIEEELCKSLNEAYIHHMLVGKPLLTLRYSLSVNGNLLDSLGNGVTESGGYYSRLLQEYDAVIMSSSLFRESLSADLLPLSQEPGANQPIQIIVHKDSGSSNKIPLVNNKVNDKVIIFTDCRETAASEKAQQGIETVSLDEINLDAILDYCNRQGLCSVLLDMRGNFNEYEELVKEGIKKKYINKFVTEILPVWNGCTQNDPLLQLKNLDQGVKVENLRSMVSAQSVVVEGCLNLK
ncbi:Cytidine/deoxycytidylate deaminase family protein [Trifolium repens]|nr:Cytidine/deoxycytidylate deaminase family protein [Trifolium repens]